MRKILTLILTAILSTSAWSVELNKDLFKVINLDYKGLEKVKKLHSEGKDQEAAKALLEYYKSRKDVSHPDIDLANVKISKNEQKWVDDAMEHKFFVHEGYQPSYFYGDDIDWQYWPIKDNELRWQLHRTKWWQPMGKAYYITKDEKYAKEWVSQYTDWIKKNPLILDKFSKDDPTADVDALDNVRFAWRPLEVSHRVQDQTIQFLLFLNSKDFTPEFLSQFLVNYDKHAKHLRNNYSERGNHLLFEAQRLLYAGSCFPELKDATEWRTSGIEVLLREMKEQVYDDGVQYELDLGYHQAAINIFSKAANIAQINGFGKEFPAWYFSTIEKMINVTIDTNFPDYTQPMFSDNKLTAKGPTQRNFREWRKAFNNNKQIRYFASDRKFGEAPAYLSSAFKTGGFYIFRNGWDEDATQMVVKAGPKAFWHNQPDNGTFELYINGRNFFHDSGSYVYGGDEETLKQREWFRQTRVHNTLTLNNESLNETESKCLLWKTGSKEDILVTENQSYPDLKHRRSVFFVDQKFFVIVDEAVGAAKGEVGIHYHMSEGKLNIANEELKATTQYDDKNNLLVQAFADNSPKMIEEEGWVSYKIRQKTERPAFAYTVDKKDDNAVRFITILYPIKDDNSVKKADAKFTDKGFAEDGLSLELSVDKKKYKLSYKL